MDRPYLLVSDVDNTLLGDDSATEALVAWLEKSPVRLALNSGRFAHSLLKSVDTTPLPCPDAMIGGVGTEICLAPDWLRLPNWPPHSPTWDANVIRRELLAEVGVELQPEEFLSEYKVSFFAHDFSEARLKTLSDKLAACRQAAQLVYSSQRDLDALPLGVDKGTSAAFLANYWNIPKSHVFVAGDSGNDLCMFQQGFRGIAVSNSHPELKSLPAEVAYQAAKPYAAGVIEGLEHWLS